MSAPLTVGQLREGLMGLPDDAQMFIRAVGWPDVAIRSVEHSTQIPWSHDCTDADEDHQPGRDCPTVIGLEIDAAPIEEVEAES